MDSPADLERLRAPDQYEQELIVAAEVRAYFQIAYKVCLKLNPSLPELIRCSILVSCMQSEDHRQHTSNRGP